MWKTLGAVPSSPNCLYTYKRIAFVNTCLDYQIKEFKDRFSMNTVVSLLTE